MRLFEKTLDSEVIYNGKIFDVRKDSAELENGNTAVREVVIHSGGVCAVPLTDDGEVVFVRQFRYPFKEVLIEIPAGKLEKGEDRREAGLRELKEEIGASCEKFEYLGVIYPSVAFLSEKIYMYLATGLTFGELNPDDDEFLDVFKVKFDDALKMIDDGEIKDAKTITALLLADRFIKRLK